MQGMSAIQVADITLFFIQLGKLRPERVKGSLRALG